VNAGPRMVMACPGARQGEILIRHYNDNTSCVIPGHTNNISAIAINNEGSIIASASERGTLVRVFDTRNTRDPLKVVRRGTNPATIKSIALNRLGTELAVGSETGTVHLFSCEDGPNNYNSSSYLYYFGSPEETSGIRIYVDEPSPTVAFGNDKGTFYIIGSKLGCWEYTYGADTPTTETQVMMPDTFVS
jgi:WD40 repeat protein